MVSDQGKHRKIEKIGSKTIMLKENFRISFY